MKIQKLVERVSKSNKVSTCNTENFTKDLEKFIESFDVCTCTCYVRLTGLRRRDVRMPKI